MAYQNVGTPRFYIDQIQYLKSLGFDFEKWYDDWGYNTSSFSSRSLSILNDPDLFTLEPEIQKNKTHENDRGYIAWDIPTGYGSAPTLTGNNIGRYVAILNHNIATKQEGLYAYSNWQDYFETYNGTGITEETILNYESVQIQFDGCTIFEYSKDYGGYDPGDEEKFVRIGIQGYDSSIPLKEINIGALSWGVYYDMPHSPELDLTMTIENDGYDAITTQGGAHLSNVRYTGAPMWERVDGTKVPPWTIGEPTTAGRRHGRRVWDLQFNYLNDSDLFASNYMNTNYMQSGSDTGYDSEDIDTNDFYYTLENDNSFHAQVLNKVGNGQRFIFQPDNTNNNPDQFAICQLDQDSLDISQVANGVYNIKLKIREVW